MSQHTLQRVSILLSLITVVAVVLGAKMVITKMDSIAAMQYGGQKNYTLAQKLFANEKFQAQQAQQLQSALDQVNGTTPAAPAPSAAAPAPTQETFPGGKLTQDQIAAIKKTAFVEGAANAKISIIEYSDPECPYCIRQYNDKTVENAVAAFPGSVNHIFKLVQGVNHEGTQKKSYAILCAAEQKGLDGYVGMYKAILGGSTVSSVISTDKIGELATGLGMDAAKLATCIDKAEVRSVYEANWAEFKTFTASPGTPGNIILNNETGAWKLIAGAYPVDTFKQLIAELSK